MNMPSPKLDDSVCVFISDGLLNIQHRLLFLLSPLHKAGPDDHSVLAGSAFAEFGTLGEKRLCKSNMLSHHQKAFQTVI